jgi:SAM-dependent methyltransferase
MMVARFIPYAGLAPSYDVALGRDSFRRTAAALRQLIERYAIGFGSAADIGCGTGLFAAHIARRWAVPVFAVDRSRSMLTEAIHNGSADHVRLICQDIRGLSLPRPVDLITANFDTLNHIVEPAGLVATFRHVHANLKRGGHFIFDFVTDRQPCRASGVYIRRLPVTGCEMVQRIIWNSSRSLIFIDLTQHCPQLGVHFVERHVERAYSPVDIVRWLRACGFFVRAVLDAATLLLAHSGSSRIIVVARRRDHLDDVKGRREAGALRGCAMQTVALGFP